MENSELKNETKKAEEKMRKEWGIQDLLGSLDKTQQMVLSYLMHITLQKGRVMGRMEMDGKTAEEIAAVLKVPEEEIQKMINEDPFEVIAH